MDALQSLGLSKEASFNAVSDINLEMRRGSCRVWRAFTDAIHRSPGEKCAREDMEDADCLIDEIFDGEQDYDLRCIGERLNAWPPQRRLKWVKHYIDIEQRTGSRRRGIMEARAARAQWTVRTGGFLRARMSWLASQTGQTCATKSWSDLIEEIPGRACSAGATPSVL